MKYAVCIEMLYTEVPFYERVALAKADGFDYITFWGWEDKDIPRLKEECERNGVTVADFVGDNNPYSLLLEEDHGAYYDKFMQSIAAAKQLGSLHILLHSDSTVNWVAKPVPASLSREKKVHSMVTMLDRLGAEAERAGIPLLLESLNNTVDHFGYYAGSTADAIEVIRRLKTGNVKFLYDIYHMQIMEGNVIETIRANLGDIGYIHFADVPGRHEPDTGELNLPNILNAMVDMGYDGMLEFELNPKHHTETAIRSIKAAVGASRATPIPDLIAKR